jgi:phage terminase large subunit
MEITLTPTYKQHLANLALDNPLIDVIFLGGGAGGGKSWEICESRLSRAYRWPGYKSFIGREELKRLMQSTYLTWVKVCSHHKIPQDDWKLNGQYNFIEFKNGSRIDLLDLKALPTDPLYERFGSLEYTDGAIEEAGEVEFLAYDVLKTRVGRWKNKELGIHPNLLITGNPKKNWTYRTFYKPWKEGVLPTNHVFIQSLYNDNPHTAEDYGKQLSQISDSANKQRLMFGNWEYENDPATLIKYEAINDLFTNTVSLGEKYLVADVARYGSDKTVITIWKGMECYQVHTFVKQSIPTTALKIQQFAADENIPYSHIIIDEDGVGGGAVDLLTGVKGFVANSKPFDNLGTFKPDNYKNLKAQCAYKLADLVNARRLAVRTEDYKIREMLTEELEQIKSKDIDSDTKLQIVSKDEVKEMIGRSPDYGDCLIMRMYFEFDKPFNQLEQMAMVSQARSNKQNQE